MFELMLLHIHIMCILHGYVYQYDGQNKQEQFKEITKSFTVITLRSLVGPWQIGRRWRSHLF